MAKARRSKWTTPVLAMLVVTVVRALLPSGPAGATGSGAISGTVTAAASGAPLAGICVSMQAIGGHGLTTVTTTGMNGAYILEAGGPYSGDFTVSFSAGPGCPGNTANYATEYYHAAATSPGATPVKVTPGQTTPDIDAAMVGAPT